MPVSELYSGVLYDALGYATLSAGSKRRAGNRLLVVSAAWGALRMADRVPPYRLSMGTTLPGHRAARLGLARPAERRPRGGRRSDRRLPVVDVRRCLATDR